MRPEIHVTQWVVEVRSNYGQCVVCEPLSGKRMRERPAEATLPFYKEKPSLIERSKSSRCSLAVARACKMNFL